MRAAVYRRFGGPDVVRVREVAIPVPRANEIRIRVHASTVSAADHRTRSGEVPRGLRFLAGFSIGFLRPRRRILGMDAAGVVDAVGSAVTTFAPGDEVIAMLGARFGGHGEYAIVSEQGGIAAKPASLSFDQAAALIFGGITAHVFLKRASLAPDTRVLITGASGVVGMATIQLAKSTGAHVTAVARAATSELLLKLGADEVIDYTVTDFARNGGTYDVIVDCAGTAPYERVAAILRPGGALLLVVTDLRGLLEAPRQARASGVLVTAATVKYTPEAMAAVAVSAATGVLRPVIDRTYPLSEIVDAHRRVDAGRKSGSVVLQLTEPAQETS